MEKISVILVDDHSIMREGLKMIIDNDDHVRVAGEAENMADAINIIAREKPDIVLLDLDLGTESSLDNLDKIFSVSDLTRILVLTGVTDQEQHKRAMQLGAQGVLLKKNAANTLLKAIKKVYKGEVWLDRTLTAELLSDASRSPDPDSQLAKFDSLTPRELEIVDLIAEGMTNKEIAGRLFVGEKTIRNNLTIIYSKLDVSSRLELAIHASRN